MDKMRAVFLLIFMTLGFAHAGTTRPVPCTPSGYWLDVAVAIDYSNKAGTNGILQAVSDISTIFFHSKISQNNGQYTRISISNYTIISNIMVPLDYFNSTYQFENEVFNIIPSHTVDADGYISSGLQSAGLALSVGRSDGKRDNVPQVAMIFASEYNSQTNGGAVTKANQLKSDGITIIVTDNSKAQNISGLDEIASPGMVFLGNDPQFLQKVQAALCAANSFCKAGWTQVSDSFLNGTNLKGECVRTGQPTKIARSTAVSNCNSWGGYLVSEFDQAKHDFVYAMALEAILSPSPVYWIGLTSSSSGVKQWDQMPGTTPIPSSTSDWSNWNSAGIAYIFGPSYPEVIVGYTTGTWSCENGYDVFTVCQTNTCDTDNYCGRS